MIPSICKMRWTRNPRETLGDKEGFFHCNKCDCIYFELNNIHSLGGFKTRYASCLKCKYEFSFSFIAWEEIPVSYHLQIQERLKEEQ